MNKNGTKQLFASFVRKGMSDRDALFAILDHYHQQWMFDRDRYNERLKALEGGGSSSPRPQGSQDTLPD